MKPTFRGALFEGLTDAGGFFVGALAGWSLGRLLGFDFFAAPSFDARAMVGLVFIAVAGGAGKWLARIWLEHGRREP